MTRARDLADFNLDGKAVTINESSADLDFRVESNGNANMLVVDAGNDRVGIATASPSYPLDVSGSTNVAAFRSDASNSLVHLPNSGSSGGDNSVSIASVNNDFYVRAGDAERMRITSDGNVGIGVSDVRHPIHIAYSETGSIPTDHQIGASSDNKNYLGFHNTSDSATYSGIALETRTSGASRWLIANERQSDFVGDLVFLTRDGGTSGSEVVRIQNNGNVGIGVTPTQKLHVSGNAIVTGIARLGDGSASSPAYQFVSDTNTGMFNAASDTLGFSTGGSEKLRLDSNGKLYLGTTSTIAGAHISHLYDSNDGSGLTMSSTDSSGNTHNQVIFIRNGSTVGTISTTASNTAYGTTSDRRLKSNIQDAESASDKIDALRVRQFDWNVDGSHQDYGLIAQELEPIEPLAVTGDADSDEMMGVDYSKLVPMLLKEIQELRSRVAALEAN